MRIPSRVTGGRCRRENLVPFSAPAGPRRLAGSHRSTELRIVYTARTRREVRSRSSPPRAQARWRSPLRLEARHGPHRGLRGTPLDRPGSHPQRGRDVCPAGRRYRRRYRRHTQLHDLECISRKKIYPALQAHRRSLLFRSRHARLAPGTRPLKIVSYNDYGFYGGVISTHSLTGTAGAPFISRVLTPRNSAPPRNRRSATTITRFCTVSGWMIRAWPPCDRGRRGWCVDAFRGEHVFTPACRDPVSPFDINQYRKNMPQFLVAVQHIENQYPSLERVFRNTVSHRCW